MTLKKLNPLGMAHYLIPLAVFVLVGVGGGAYLIIKSHAASAPFTPVDFIKTQNTPGGMVEVHRITAASNYKTHDIDAATRFSDGDRGNGTFQMVGNDLYFIKIANTGSGKVEIFSATAASGYKSGISAATALGVGDGANGTFQMVGNDLYFIKTANTGGGKVELHVLTGASNYQTFSLHVATAFSTSDATNGTWRMVSGNNLALVKTANTTGGKVELHIATAASNYQTFSLHTSTVFNDADAANGWFSATDANNDGVTDVSFIKTKNTGSGDVEVFYAEGNSYGSLGYSQPTAFSPADADNGTWQIGDAIVPTPPPAPKPAPGSNPTSSNLGSCTMSASPARVTTDTSNLWITITNHSGSTFTSNANFTAQQTFYSASGPVTFSPYDLSYLFNTPLQNGQTHTYSLGGQNLPSYYDSVTLTANDISARFKCSTTISH